MLKDNKDIIGEQYRNNFEGDFKDLAYNLQDYRMPEYSQEDWQKDINNIDVLFKEEIEPLKGKPKKKCKK